ncbi:MAG: class I SAM-dependent methyltransferase [Arenicellales bacterium]
MSRLDSMIRRLEAQRACIEWALRSVEGLDGVILELGLGNGRTFDHLREHAAQREIYVFERAPAAHPDCTPSVPYLIEGDFRESLQSQRPILTQQAALAHCDIGSGHSDRDRQLAIDIGPILNDLLRPGAIVLSDKDFAVPECQMIPGPANVTK